MSTPDEKHDDAAGKTDGHDHDQHSHDDAHAEVATDFIAENSGLDQLLKLVVVLTGLGIVTMLFIWYTGALAGVPEESAASEHSAPAPLPTVAPAAPEQPTAKPVP